MQTRLITKALQRFTKHDLGCNIYHRNASHLTDIRYRTRGTRIYFDDIHFIVIDYILNVNQTNCVQFLCQKASVSYNSICYRFTQILRRIDRNRVARVHACTLYVFHDSGNQIIGAITNCIDFHLGTHHILIDQNWIFNHMTCNNRHILYDILV